jgi:hypothetical protein
MKRLNRILVIAIGAAFLATVGCFSYHSTKEETARPSVTVPDQTTSTTTVPEQSTTTTTTHSDNGLTTQQRSTTTTTYP